MLTWIGGIVIVVVVVVLVQSSYSLHFAMNCFPQTFVSLSFHRYVMTVYVCKRVFSFYFFVQVFFFNILLCLSQT